jgi:NhaA family Na+:H+ antiporter
MSDEELQRNSLSLTDIPQTRIDRWTRPFVRFFQIQSVSGFLLVGCMAIALILANSPWSESFAGIWDIRIGLTIGHFELNKPLLLWINDGLMTVFFFVVGLEIKREFVSGELRDRRKAVLPVVAAVGGMLLPAGIYLLFQRGQPGQSGWGVPVATDIAFVAGFLALFGARIPVSLKIMLMALAIVDDLGAIILIACFYSTDISFGALGVVLVGLGMTYLFNRIGIRPVSIYLILGTGVWFTCLKSGIHPTVAGVLLGFMTPSKAWVGTAGFPQLLTGLLERLVSRSHESSQKQRYQALDLLATTAREGTSPLERLEAKLHPWVAFLIMPLFALANAGVKIELAALGSSVAIAIACGLALGKPIGILLFSWIAIRLGIARLPSDVNWWIMLGAGCLGGIGFTMSIFIASLALQSNLLNQGKIGILAGSAISALLGCLLLFLFIPSPTRRTPGRNRDQLSDQTSTASIYSQENSENWSQDRWSDDGGQTGQAGGTYD